MKTVSDSANTPLCLKASSIYRLHRIAAAVVIALGALGLGLQYIGLDPQIFRRLRQMIDLDAEASLPSYYTCSLILTNAVLLSFIAWHQQKAGSIWSNYWKILAGGFVLLSMDEAIMIHELFGAHLAVLYPAVTTVLGMHQWVILGFAVVLLLALFFVRFLRSLPVIDRWRFILAGAVYVSGGVGAETVQGFLSNPSHDNPTYLLLVLTEESMEMFGQMLFLRALILYSKDHLKLPSLDLRILL